MKIIITESQYRNLFEQTTQFEKDEKLIRALLSKFNYEGICGYDMISDDDSDRVRSIILKFSKDWYRSSDETMELNRKFNLIKTTKDEIKKMINKYIGLKNIYIGSVLDKCD